MKGGGLLLTLLGSLLIGAGLGAIIAQADIICEGSPPPCYGNDKDNQIQGSPWHDDIRALGGSDLVWAHDAKDYVEGNNGSDKYQSFCCSWGLAGENDDDTIKGQNDDDILFGGTGGDELYGGDNRDILYGQDGGDYLNGGPGSDICVPGGQGGDQIVNCE